ncbi:mobilization protein MobD [Mangrovimicrobium sediminis]|uniref:Mobilization protein MobD n=1 Tax=Mangrovimicrobium sediminis TaxID=2562682 RepID=A0A4Z0M6M8_9GAMM|nr:mobilization protein MobD [Haliea sp. SAOS-164]TGD75154.1 mobilization protein MobD [Haliea sp. SAOS-164]
MSNIHFVGGEKGGVGKSVFSRLLSQYFLDHSQTYLGLDADQSHGTLTRFYPEFTRAINLDTFSSIDQIMESALEEELQVIVDLPAQSERFLERWLEESGVLELCEETGTGFTYWYVIDDGLDSAQLLQKFLGKHATNMPCVVVQNLGCGSNFSAADAALAATGEAASCVRRASVPELHADTMRKIDNLSLSFWAAQHLKDADTPGLSLMERQRAKMWLKKAYQAIGQALPAQAPAV